MLTPYRHFDVIHPQTGERVYPSFGVGYGGQGFWGNRHFATIEEAQAFFDYEVDVLLKAFSTVRPQVTDVKGTEPILRIWTILNTKKNGKAGKIKQTIHLYRIIDNKN